MPEPDLEAPADIEEEHEHATRVFFIHAVECQSKDIIHVIKKRAGLPSRLRQDTCVFNFLELPDIIDLQQDQLMVASLEQNERLGHTCGDDLHVLCGLV